MAQWTTMQLVFAPGEEEEFAAARAELADSFLAWAEEHGREVDPFVLSAALDYKYGVDGRVGRWQRGDLRAVLTEWFPRKVTMRDPDRPAVVPSLHAMVDFLIDHRLLDSRSARPGELHAEIDAQAPHFRAAMADERNYDLGKFWAMKMLEHDVDLHDRAAVGRFMAAAQAGDIDIDQDVVDGILQRQFFPARPEPAELPGLPALPGLPPVRLPSPDELLAAAQTSVVLQRLRALVRWLGTGRKLTRTGRLTVADGRELAGLLGVDEPFLARARSSADLPAVSLVVAWARAARLVRPVKGRLVPIKSAAPLLDRPVELWQRAFDVFGELGEPLSGRSLADLPSLFIQTFAETVPVLWLSLYTAGGTPLPVELLYRILREALSERFDVPGRLLIGTLQQHMWWLDLLRVLEALDELGAIHLAESTEPAERVKIAELSGRDNPMTKLAQLTPIGLWVANRLLRDQGIDAPVVGELAAEDLGVVHARLAHAALEAVGAELAAWVEARGPVSAAAEVARWLEHTGEPSHRLFALLALTYTGEPGLAQAHRIRAGGGVAGAVVAGWLADQGAIDPAALREPELLLGLTDHLAALQEEGVLVDELAGRSTGEQVDLVHRIAASAHPSRLRLLDTIAEDHPDRAVARAARKLRLKLRSAGLD